MVFPENTAQPEEKAAPYKIPIGQAHQIQVFSLQENISVQ